MPVCKAWDNQFSDGAAERANPECVCETTAAALLCRTGHLLECHYPKTCEEARCSHWQRNQEAAALAITEP